MVCKWSFYFASTAIPVLVAHNEGMSTRSSRYRRAIRGTFRRPCSQELTVWVLTPMNLASSSWLALSFLRTALT